MRERTYKFPKRSFITIVVLLTVLVVIYFLGFVVFRKSKPQKVDTKVQDTAQVSPSGGPAKPLPDSPTAKIDGLTAFSIKNGEITSLLSYRADAKAEDATTTCDGYTHAVIDQPSEGYRAYLCHFYLKPNETCFSTKAETDPHPCPDKSSIGIKSIKLHSVTRKSDGQISDETSGAQLILAINIPGSSANPSKWWATEIVETDSGLYNKIKNLRAESTIEQGTLFPVTEATRACPALELCAASLKPEKYLMTKSKTIYHIIQYDDSKLVGIGG